MTGRPTPAEHHDPADHNADDTAPANWQPRAARAVTTLLVGRLLCDDGSDDLCRIRNVSTGGMLVETHHPLQPAQQIAVELRSGRKLTGKVVWTVPGRGGVQFDEGQPIEQILSTANRRVTVAGQPKPRAPRFDAHCPASLNVHGRALAAMVMDLSQSGARLHVNLPEALDEQMTVSIAGLAPRRCVLRWMIGEDAGVSFVEMIPFGELADWLERWRDGMGNAGID